MEIKTGTADLNKHQRMVKKAVRANKVKAEEI
jgi:predicted Holliday junction resolvase-like endonuclease